MMLRRMTSRGATIVLDTVAAIAPDSRCTRASLERSLHHARRTTTPTCDSPSGSVGCSCSAVAATLHVFTGAASAACSGAAPPRSRTAVAPLAWSVVAVISVGAATSSSMSAAGLVRDIGWPATQRDDGVGVQNADGYPR